MIDLVARLRQANKQRRCPFTGCITLLYSDNPGPYCFLHTTPDYKFATQSVEDWMLELRKDGIPPRGNLSCEDCGRIRKSSTSCVCKATPAPRRELVAV